MVAQPSSPPTYHLTAGVAALFAVAAASMGNASKIAPDQHFPLMPDIPISSTAPEPRRRTAADGESMSSVVEDNFVLITDDVSDFEDELLRNAVIGEPLTYQDNNLGRDGHSPYTQYGI